jgi:hypothetical protein
MGDLRFNLTFFGGKADEHRVLANRLADLLRSMGDDLVSVCRLISTEDVNIDLRELENECKLYVVAAPKASTLTITVAATEAHTDWVAQAGEVWLESLADLYTVPGSIPDEKLPKGINRSILEHVINYSTPIAGEYDGIRLAVANGRPERTIVFNERLKRAAEQRLAALIVPSPPTIHHHTIQGILYAVQDQNYDNPQSSITVEVDTGSGTRWSCRIKKNLVPEDIEQYWEKRVILIGLATFRPRIPQMEVEQFTILSEKPDIDTIIDRFIKIGEDAWKSGPNLSTYMSDVRER